jgi:hypothetical protein
MPLRRGRDPGGRTNRPAPVQSLEEIHGQHQARWVITPVMYGIDADPIRAVEVRPQRLAHGSPPLLISSRIRWPTGKR